METKNKSLKIKSGKPPDEELLIWTEPQNQMITANDSSNALLRGITDNQYKNIRDSYDNEIEFVPINNRIPQNNDVKVSHLGDNVDGFDPGFKASAHDVWPCSEYAVKDFFSLDNTSGIVSLSLIICSSLLAFLWMACTSVSKCLLYELWTFGFYADTDMTGKKWMMIKYLFNMPYYSRLVCCDCFRFSLGGNAPEPRFRCLCCFECNTWEPKSHPDRIKYKTKYKYNTMSPEVESFEKYAVSNWRFHYKLCYSLYHCFTCKCGRFCKEGIMLDKDEAELLKKQQADFESKAKLRKTDKQLEDLYWEPYSHCWGLCKREKTEFIEPSSS